MFNAPKMNLLQLPVGKDSESAKLSTRWRHQASLGKICLEAELVQPIGAIRRIRSNTKLAAGIPWETHLLSNEDKENWIEGYVDRETALGSRRVQDAETAIKQEQEDMRNAEKAGLTTTKPETAFEDILNSIRDDLSKLASSDDGKAGAEQDDDEEDPEVCKMCEDDKPGWVMGTIHKTAFHRMECVRQQQMMPDELMQRGWGDAAHYFSEKDQKYGTTKLKVLAMIQLQTEDDAASSAPTIFGEPMETFDSVPSKLPML